jgi:GTP-binding protein
MATSNAKPKPGRTAPAAKSRPVPHTARNLPIVAIVGRPNVGKSTLFNRLVGGHNAIVEDEPGVTRDRRYGDSEYDGIPFRVVDTGGLDLSAHSGLTKSIQRQALRAVEEADVLLFVVDAQEGLLPDDLDVAERLRRHGKPLLFVANKVDGARQELGMGDIYRLGADQVFGISAAHGRGLPDLLDAIVAQLRLEPPVETPVETPDTDTDTATISVIEHTPPDNEALIEAEPDHVVRIAFVGRPNAGKSSLVNALVGDERMIVDDTPGTTRDPVDTLLEHNGRRYLLIDTAGIRRRARIAEPMEKVAVAMAERALYRADVAILTIDGQAGIGEQDARIAGLVQDSGRALVIAFNKRDLIAPGDEKRLKEELERKLQFVSPWALTRSCSAKNGRGVTQLLGEARRCYRWYSHRVGTGALNRFFEDIVERHPPPLHNGKPIRLYYITQAETCPPTFVVRVNHPEGMHFSYRRYLQNQLRETFGFVGTPIRLITKAR